jgi:riboflavin kinase/FMN adenylyltransferase
VTALSKEFGFHVDYFPDYEIGGQRISSSQIREHIKDGNLIQAKRLLGRCYSVFGQVLKGHGRGADFGFPTANLDVSNLCVPPLGVYAVSLVTDGMEYQGVANLGIAPTVRQEDDPILEVHLIDKQIDLYSKYVEVIFHEYIRPEKRFEGIEMLKKQIAQDVLRAKDIHVKRATAH